MRSKSFYTLVLSALLVFAVIASQGCGGSSNKFRPVGYSGDSGEDEETSRTGSIVIGGESILVGDNLDTDNNGKPDFLDFDGVSITHVQASESPSSITVQAPSMTFFKELKDADKEDPDTVHVNLQAGTEYTVEFSKNLADSVTSLLPRIEIISPVSNEPLQYFFEDEDDESSTTIPADQIQLSLYPKEDPSIICMTFTPSVTGEYIIRVSRQEIEDAEIEDVESGDVTASNVTASDDKSAILFIYKELRNEDGDAGYYTRFKFEDDFGSKTDTLDIGDVIEMRKLYLSFAPDYLTKYYGELTPNTKPYDDITEEQISELFAWLYLMQEHQGLYVVEEDTEESSGEDTLKPDKKKEESSGDTPAPEKEKKKKKVKPDSESGRTTIDTTISGLRYDASYKLGNGFMGVMGYPAVGHAINKFTLPVPEKKVLGATRYKADFISSQQEMENFSKTTAGIGLSIGGFGLSASLSHMSSYKFGITSATFVIHYDVLEAQARELDIADYKLTEYAEAQLKKGYDHFRNLYGDYFVAGYTYGGTYDAYISITTETVEQLKEVKSQVKAQFQIDSLSLDAKVANETKDILKRNNASVSIEIRTSGISASSPNPQIITPSHGKNSIESVNDVISELQKFRSQLAQQSPADFAPVNVILQRYTLLGPVLAQMVEDGEDGTIPIRPDMSVIIQNFNRSLRTLGAYYQVIGGLDDSKIDAEVRDNYHSKYMDLYNKVRLNPKFYDDLDKVEETKKEITELSTELKAMGDRYVFYRMLMAAQRKERSKYNEHRGYEENAGYKYVKYQPFGEVGGGSIGYSEFPVSEAVTKDIQDGKKQVLDGTQDFTRAGWNYWGTSSHNMQNVNRSYDAETADGKTDAAFCYVLVQTELSNADTDRHRRFENTPVVGKSRLEFDFTSGYSRWATWTVTYKTFKFSRETYPFFGLER